MRAKASPRSGEQAGRRHYDKGGRMRPFWRRFKDASLAVLLLFAALNAASYFFRSTHPSLLGYQDGQDGLGCPFLAWTEDDQKATLFLGDGIWDDQNRLGPLFPAYLTIHLGSDGVVSYPALLANLGCGLACAGIVGLLAGRYGKWQPTAHRPPAAQRQPLAPPRPPQFSLRGLFLAITIVALVIGLDRIAADRFRTVGLATIYALGPAILAVVAGIPRRSRRRQIFAIWLTLTVLLSGAVVLGVHSSIGDFTRVLLGLFVFWTPQCVLALAVIAGSRFVQRSIPGIVRPGSR